MASNIVLKAIGLNLSPNALDSQSTPPGSLLEASNVIIKRDNVVEPRRGYPLYGTAMGTSSDRAKQLMTYKGRILRHYSNKLQYDTLVLNANGESIFNTFCGNYLEPQTGRRIRFIESNGNFYFTTSEGVKKISAKTAADFTTACPFITQAGGIKALDLTSELSITLGNETGFLPQDSAVAYRVVWGSTDANGNLILGAPSQRSVIYNPMLSLELLDFNNLLIQLDNVGNNTAFPSLISDTNYFSTLNLPIAASAFDLNTNLLALSTKLDDDILYANDVATAPLQISGASINDSVATISFTSGNPADYLHPGSLIKLAGFTADTGSINGGQTVATIVPTFTTTGDTTTGQFEQTRAVVNSPDVSGDYNGRYFTLNAANDVRQYYVWFNVSNGGTDPMIPNKLGIRVNIATGATIAQIAAAMASAIDGFAEDFGTSISTTNVANDTVTVQNIDVGVATDGTAATSTFTVTTPQQGVSANVIINVASTAGIQVGSIITGTGIPANTYVTSIGVGTIGISNNATATNTTVTFTFGAGINFLTAATGPVTFLTPTINSNEYESIPVPTTPSTPATHDQLQSLQDYLQNIITQLQSEPDTGTPPTISANSQTTFITPIQLTTTANVILTITIPAEVTTNNFFQIYRSDIASATGTQVLATDIFPNDELRLVYEAFPTDAEIAAGVVVVLDQTPPEFAGAFLYTNSTTGEGILQANDVPPFALDINKYKNVLFYANTRTRFNRLINLLGVTNIIASFNAGDNPSFTITDGITTHTYTFVTGLQEITNIKTIAATTLAGKYFNLNSANDLHQYYFWYVVSGTGTDPMVAGRTGVSIQVNTGDSATVVAQKTANVLSSLALDFTTNDTFSITNISVANPTNVISTNHGLVTGDTIIVSGSNSTPTIDGSRVVTVLNANTFTVPVNVTVAGNTGSYTTTNNIIATTVGFGPTTDGGAGTSGFTVTVTQQGRGANAALNEILLSTNPSPAQAVDETARSIVNIINQQANEIVNAFYLSDASAVPGQIQFEARSLNQGPFYILSNNTSVGSSFNPDISPTLQITSITATNPTVITTSTPHGLINQDQVVISGSDSTPSVDGLYTITYISATTFSIPVNVTVAGTTGGVRNASTTLQSTNLGQVNRIYYSKINQPEAVPIVNFLDVGAQDKEILRIFPLRDSLFVYKEDGLYRISGEIAPFNLALFDLSCILLAPDSLDVSNNLLYGWTTQGITSTSESGVNIISRPIDIDILKLATEQYVNFRSATWGIGYESDNSYTAYTVQELDDVYATIGYRYSTLTNTWTTFAKTDTCGVINSVNDRQYLGAGDINYLEQERKNFNRLDYADRQYVQQIGAGNFFGNQIQIQDITLAAIGDVITQDQYMTVYNYNSLLTRLDTDLTLNHDYFSTLEMLTGDNPRTKLDALIDKIATDSIRIVQPGALPGSDYTKYKSILGTFTITDISSDDPTVITTSAPHGLTDGRQITIVGSNSTPSIDGVYQVTVLSPTTFTIPVNVLMGSYSITNITVANPTHVTSANHGLITGQQILISGSNSTPTINGLRTVTVLDDDTFTVPVNVTIAGNTGSWLTNTTYAVNNNNFLDIQASYNGVIITLNADPGITLGNYMQITNSTLQEAIIIAVDLNTNRITLHLTLEWLIGPITLFKAIPSDFLYSPQDMGDSLSFKHFRESLLFFENKAFSGAILSFASDLLPAFIDVDFMGTSNGIFGFNNFGFNFFGGASHAAPFRTYVPRNVQRCRFLNLKFEHSTAREKYSLFGIVVVGENTQSSRAYR